MKSRDEILSQINAYIDGLVNNEKDYGTLFDVESREFPILRPTYDENTNDVRASTFTRIVYGEINNRADKILWSQSGSAMPGYNEGGNIIELKAAIKDFYTKTQDFAKHEKGFLGFTKLGRRFTRPFFAQAKDIIGGAERERILHESVEKLKAVCEKLVTQLLSEREEEDKAQERADSQSRAREAAQRTPPDQDPYLVFGIDRNADTSTIKKTFKSLSLKFHPDRAATNNITLQEATEKFKKISAANEILSDPEKRAAWDALHPVESTTFSPKR